jgi:hypothetical protein
MMGLEACGLILFQFGKYFIKISDSDTNFASVDSPPDCMDSAGCAERIARDPGRCASFNTKNLCPVSCGACDEVQKLWENYLGR